MDTVLPSALEAPQGGLGWLGNGAMLERRMRWAFPHPPAISSPVRGARCFDAAFFVPGILRLAALGRTGSKIQHGSFSSTLADSRH